MQPSATKTPCVFPTDPIAYCVNTRGGSSAGFYCSSSRLRVRAAHIDAWPAMGFALLACHSRPGRPCPTLPVFDSVSPFPHDSNGGASAYFVAARLACRSPGPLVATPTASPPVAATATVPCPGAGSSRQTSGASLPLTTAWGPRRARRKVVRLLAGIYPLVRACVPVCARADACGSMRAFLRRYLRPCHGLLPWADASPKLTVRCSRGSQPRLAGARCSRRMASRFPESSIYATVASLDRCFLLCLSPLVSRDSLTLFHWPRLTVSIRCASWARVCALWLLHILTWRLSGPCFLSRLARSPMLL